MTAPNIVPLVEEIASIAGSSTDFLTNSLALRKRMYYIMVEMACIHEQFRSSLIHRAQLIEEGQFIRDTLREFPDNPGTGIDTMVP